MSKIAMHGYSGSSPLITITISPERKESREYSRIHRNEHREGLGLRKDQQVSRRPMFKRMNSVKGRNATKAQAFERPGKRSKKDFHRI